MPNVAPGKDSGPGGNSVPLTGNAEIVSQSSALDALTITGASGTGALLDLRLVSTPGTTGDGNTRFLVNSSGENITRRGGTVLLTSAAAQSLGTSQSGAFVVQRASTVALTLTLPAPVAGLYYRYWNLGVGAPAAIITSVGSTGSWRVGADAATDGVLMSTVAGVGAGCVVNCYAISSTQWLATQEVTGSSLGFSSAGVMAMAPSS